MKLFKCFIFAAQQLLDTCHIRLCSPGPEFEISITVEFRTVTELSKISKLLWNFILIYQKDNQNPLVLMNFDLILFWFEVSLNLAQNFKITNISVEVGKSEEFRVS
jgi:hypothetical protein